MEVQSLAPAMQHGKEAGGHAEMLGIGGNGEEGFGGGVEEDVVDEFAVVEGNGGDGLGQREDHVELLGGHAEMLGIGGNGEEGFGGGVEEDVVDEFAVV